MTETAIYVLIWQAVLTGTAFFVSAYIFFLQKKEKNCCNMEQNVLPFTYSQTKIKNV